MWLSRSSADRAAPLPSALAAMRIGLAAILLYDSIASLSSPDARTSVTYTSIAVLPLALALLVGFKTRWVTVLSWLIYGIPIRQALIEPGIQNFVEQSQLLVAATSYTYWLSQFAVVGVTLLWVYFRHHDRFAHFRNWLIGANLVGLIGYVLMPTAPPRMFPEWGFTDTLAEFASVNHDSGLISFASNPYAAMPSLHAMDALIVGIVMASVCRRWISRVLWLAWPLWVTFAVMATGNHYWLDCVAGFGVAILVAVVLFRGRLRRYIPGAA